MTDMSNAEFIRDLAGRMFRSATPAMGFDQGDTDRLYVIANRLAALEQAGEPVADAGGVTQADREAYLAMNMLPEFDAADVRAGLWDKVTGVQAFKSHRLQSVAAATAAKDAEIARLKGQFVRYFHEAANAQEEVERLREGVERALCCTPSIQSERSQFHGIGDTHTRSSTIAETHGKFCAPPSPKRGRRGNKC